MTIVVPVTDPFCLLVSKGVSANMLKISSKRRRTQAEIKADKEAAAKKEVDGQIHQTQIQQLQQQILQLQ